MQLSMALGVWSVADTAEAARAAVTPAETHNTAALGLLIYDQYFLLFQLAGLILLVAMIGAIVLTLRHRKDCKAAGCFGTNVSRSSFGDGIERRKTGAGALSQSRLRVQEPREFYDWFRTLSNSGGLAFCDRYFWFVFKPKKRDYFVDVDRADAACL